MKKKVYRVGREVLEEVREAIVGHLLRVKYTMAYALEVYPGDEISYNLANLCYTNIMLYKTEIDKLLRTEDPYLQLSEESMSKINQYKNNITIYENEINLDPRYNLTVQ